MAGKGVQKGSQPRLSSVSKSVSLGSGTYATVYFGRFQGKSCAVKAARADAAKPLDKELEIFSLQSLSHPNVVSVMGFWDDPSKPEGPPCIVMEYCEMSLPEYLRENKGALKRSHGSSSATEIKIHILLQVARGLIFLHQQDVLHGDLRSSNVLTQPESKESDVPLVKIADYGFCQHVDPHTKARRANIMCEVDFLPPEMLCDSSSVLKNATLTPQVDVFMFGDVALETVTLEPVSRVGKVSESKCGPGERVILTEVERRTASFRKITQLGDKDAFIQLISSCLAEKPEQRLSTPDIEDMLRSHLHYYQENPNAGERQDKAAECEKLRAEKREDWKRMEELKEQLKTFEDCKKQMKKQLGAMENGKEAQTHASQSIPEKDRGFVATQLTLNLLAASDEIAALTVERDTLLKQVDRLELEKKKSEDQIEQLQSRANSAEKDREVLTHAKKGWTEERQAMKEQLEAEKELKRSSVEDQSTLLKKMTTMKDILHKIHDMQQLTESAVAFEKTSVAAQFVTLQDEFEMVKKGILHAIREREEASHRAQQALEDQLKAKFELDTADLRDEVMALSQDRATLKSELWQARDKLGKTQRSYNTSQVKVDDLDDTVRKQDAKIEELEQKLYTVQAVKDRLESEVARQTSEMEQLKKDWDKSEKEHKKAIKSIIDSADRYYYGAFIDKEEATPHIIDSPDVILSAVEHKVAGRWKRFGVSLGVDAYKIDTIAKDNKEVCSDCILQLVSQWMIEESGTGRRPRTWQTVVMAVKNTGLESFAEKLAKEYGISLS